MKERALSLNRCSTHWWVEVLGFCWLCKSESLNTKWAGTAALPTLQQLSAAVLMLSWKDKEASSLPAAEDVPFSGWSPQHMYDFLSSWNSSAPEFRRFITNPEILCLQCLITRLPWNLRITASLIHGWGLWPHIIEGIMGKVEPKVRQGLETVIKGVLNPGDTI